MNKEVVDYNAALDKYLEGRDFPAPHKEALPKPVPSPAPEPVVTLEMKRFIVGSLTLTGCVCLIEVVKVGAVLIAPYLGGAVAVGVVLVLLPAAFRAGAKKETPAKQTPHTSGGQTIIINVSGTGDVKFEGK